LLQELAAQVLAYSRLGFTHSTFLTLVAEAAEGFVPACSPKALADLALGFSLYRLPTGALYPVLMDSVVQQLQGFDEVQMVRLLDGLAARQGLDLGPLMTAIQVGCFITAAVCVMLHGASTLCFR
jgi:hypothetical protein